MKSATMPPFKLQNSGEEDKSPLRITKLSLVKNETKQSILSPGLLPMVPESATRITQPAYGDDGCHTEPRSGDRASLDDHELK